MQSNIIDIDSRGQYPANALSNFARYDFIIDGIECASMEGFLQSLKFSDKDRQRRMCGLVGKLAKELGETANADWQAQQTLWWQGKEYDRHGKFYQLLLDRAYQALSNNKEFCQALLHTGQANLIHSIGNDDPKKTILTAKEFCGRLLKIRDKLNNR